MRQEHLNHHLLLLSDLLTPNNFSSHEEWHRGFSGERALGGGPPRGVPGRGDYLHLRPT